MRRCQDGDQVAFDVLYRRHRAAVRVVCSSNVAGSDVIDDLVQETFSRLWASLPAFVGGDDVLHWLRRTAKNLCIDHHRRHRGRDLPLTLEVADLAAATPDPAGAVVTRHAVRGVLAKLRPVDAALLQEHHLADRPLREMAARWGSTEKSLSVRLTRARRAFAAAGTDLRSLLPVPLWLRLRWSARSELVVPAGAMTSMGVLHVALAILLVLPPAAASEPRRPTLDATVRHAAAEHVTAPATTRDRQQVRAAPGRSRAAQRRDRAADAPHGTTAEQPVIAEVGVTGTRLHRDVPERPDYHYKARAEVGPATVTAEVVVDKWEAAKAANDPACDAAAAAPAGATCTAERD